MILLFDSDLLHRGAFEMNDPLDIVLGQDQVVSALQRALRGQRLHHAYLFHGADGVGKRLAASCFAQSLLCPYPSEDELGTPSACGACKTCARLIKRRMGDTESYHPDLHWISREYSEATGKLAKEIKIQPIRELQKSLSFGAFEGGRRVIIIEEIDRLGLSAANALLKTLEEPLPDVHFLLLTDNSSAVLPTIRSRTQAVRFAPLSATILSPLLLSISELPPKEGEEPLSPLSPAELETLAQLSGGSVGRALHIWRQGGMGRVQELITLSDRQGGPEDVLGALEASQTLDKATEDELSLWLHLLRCWYRDALVSLYTSAEISLFFPAQKDITARRGQQLGAKRLQWRLNAITQTEHHLFKRVGSNRRLLIEMLLLYLAGFDSLSGGPLILNERESV